MMNARAIQSVAKSGSNGAMVEGHEATLLSRFLNDKTAIRRYTELKPEYFGSPVHREIFEAILQLHYDGHDTNYLAVQDYFRRRGKLHEIGEHTLTTLSTDSRIAAMDNSCCDYAHDCVIDAWREREAAKIGKRLHSGDIGIEDAMARLAEIGEGARGRELPQIEDAAQLISKPIVLPDDVIDGVVHRGGKLVVGGASKSYKTWLLIDLAVSVASGAEWFNGYPTRQGRVLYVNFELPAPFFAKRIATVCDERQLRLEAGMFTVWNLRGHVADWAKLQSQIPSDFYALIILDPTYKLLLGRDENKAGDVASLLNEFEVLAVRTGAAVAFGAHYSKGNQAAKESIDRIGGSGVFARDPDTILNFTRHEQPDCFTVEATLRNHPPIKPFVVRWEFPLFTVENLLDPAQLKQGGRKPDESLDRASP